jgi:predicted Zn-dependent protease
MELGRIHVVRTVKRLAEAIGYLELGMTQQALTCLDGLDEPGPFTAIIEMLRGEAARREQRFDDAARSFEAAARLLPAPDNRSLWLALSTFYRQAGNTDLAVASLAHARGARPPRAKPKAN